MDPVPGRRGLKQGYLYLSTVKRLLIEDTFVAHDWYFGYIHTIRIFFYVFLISACFCQMNISKMSVVL